MSNTLKMLYTFRLRERVKWEWSTQQLESSPCHRQLNSRVYYWTTVTSERKKKLYVKSMYTREQRN